MGGGELGGGTEPGYLLHVLLEDTQLQPLVQPHLAVLPDALQPPLVVQHLMHHIQHLVYRLGVVGRGRERLRVPRTQGALQDIQQCFAVLADLQEGREIRSGAPDRIKGEQMQAGSERGEKNLPDILDPHQAHHNY